MNTTGRFHQVTAALQDAGLRVLVIGGHAVRYYGVDRNTFDFDFHVSLDDSADLTTCLADCNLCSTGQLIEGPSWRKDEFRRFRIGFLPDGREEWLEFWLRNHLLPPFEQLWQRREEAASSGRVVCYLALSDLVRSKETERESDWQDVTLLEEILDMRRVTSVQDGADAAAALAGLRSRRGFERAVSRGLCADPTIVRRALGETSCLISLAFLLPLVPKEPIMVPGDVPGWNLLEESLRQVVPGSARHLALVEAGRRFHKRAAMEADRADKERH